MAKYHINPETGNPNRCTASKKPCPYGGDDQHYPTKKAARAAYEDMSSGYDSINIPVLTKKSTIDGDVTAASSLSPAGLVEAANNSHGLQGDTQGLNSEGILVSFSEYLDQEGYGVTQPHCWKAQDYEQARSLAQQALERGSAAVIVTEMVGEYDAEDEDDDYLYGDNQGAQESYSVEEMHPDPTVIESIMSDRSGFGDTQFDVDVDELTTQGKYSTDVDESPNSESVVSYNFELLLPSA